MNNTIQIDSLVRGRIGNLDKIGEARVFRVSSFDWVAGIDSEGRQTIIHEPEIVELPRPERLRQDIPEQLR